MYVYIPPYRKAGERAGDKLTITRLRKLLEDDVKNLNRMSGVMPTLPTSAQGLSNMILADTDDSETTTASTSSSSSAAGGGAEVGAKEEESKSKKSKKHSTGITRLAPPTTSGKNSDSLVTDISDQELADIMDRDRLFVYTHAHGTAKSQVYAAEPSPTSVTAPFSDVSTVEKREKGVEKREKAHSSVAHDVLGVSDDINVSYAVDPSIPLEGEMYDIIVTEPTTASVLQGLSV